MRARPMQLVQDAYDGTLFFYTSKSASKVFEIDNDRDVCISFSDPGKGVYVSMSGKARLSEDQELIDRYWNSYVAAWFSEGEEDDDIIMLKVKINKGEHWKVKDHKLVQLFEVAKANLTDAEKPDLGENEKFGLE